jgi:predicted GNAT superfamily acetyltransferase
MDIRLQILDTPEAMQAVEDLQSEVWVGSERDIVPGHILIAMARHGGLVIGAFVEENLVGFVCGFLGLEGDQQPHKVVHISHALAVHPDFRNHQIAFRLKRAQWQMVRHQNIDHVTWTFDPLLSLNAHLNISRLGGICSVYQRAYYGDMRDQMNAGIPSDRFVLDWWVNSSRVKNRMGKQVRKKLDLAHYLAADVPIINPSHLNDSGLAAPAEHIAHVGGWLDSHPAREEKNSLLLVEIPADFPRIRREDIMLANNWREHTRSVFEAAFTQGYLVTDFIHLPGTTPRSFYVLSRGDVKLGGIYR